MCLWNAPSSAVRRPPFIRPPFIRPPFIHEVAFYLHPLWLHVLHCCLRLTALKSTNHSRVIFLCILLKVWSFMQVNYFICLNFEIQVSWLICVIQYEIDKAINVATKIMTTMLIVAHSIKIFILPMTSQFQFIYISNKLKYLVQRTLLVCSDNQY